MVGGTSILHRGQFSSITYEQAAPPYCSTKHILYVCLFPNKLNENPRITFFSYFSTKQTKRQTNTDEKNTNTACDRDEKLSYMTYALQKPFQATQTYSGCVRTNKYYINIILILLLGLWTRLMTATCSCLNRDAPAMYECI